MIEWLIMKESSATNFVDFDESYPIEFNFWKIVEIRENN